MNSLSGKTAVLMLACRDYEAVELSLACHMAYGNPDIPFFILQNCRGSYDAERTLAVAKRYESLFPQTVRVIDSQPPGPPYRSILAVLRSERLAPFDMICKVDDDAFPIAPHWLETMLGCWSRAAAEHGPRLAYVTPLINNNNWGFPQTIKALGLEEEYYTKVARTHRVGHGDALNPYRVLGPREIATGANGTIWSYPYIARWLHRHTTFEPDRFVQATRALSDTLVPPTERYSIGCILFRKPLWAEIDSGSNDDEHMLQRHCAANDLKIVANRSVPFVHLSFFSQRDENRDLVEEARAFYEPRLGHPFPISLRSSRLHEIEARLRWLESHAIAENHPSYTADVPRSALARIGNRMERGVRSWLQKAGLKRKR